MPCVVIFAERARSAPPSSLKILSSIIIIIDQNKTTPNRSALPHRTNSGWHLRIRFFIMLLLLLLLLVLVLLLVLLLLLLLLLPKKARLFWSCCC